MTPPVLYRGNANSTVADAYADTVADYDNGGGPSLGDNTIQNVSCDASVLVGSVVRMNGATAVNAIATSKANSLVIGVCVAKPTATTCHIQTCGYTDTVLSGLSVTENYFLSATTPGELTTTVPTATGQILIHIGRAYTSQQLVIQIGPQIRRS